MTTIEPRLIALLNNDVFSESSPTTTNTYPTSPSLELPPLHDPNILKASGRPLLLEPDASNRNDKLQHASLIPSVEEDNTPKPTDLKKIRPGERVFNSSPQSLRKILGDDTGDTLIAPSKKRSMVETGKDEFVQLPQPPKKQKAAKQVVPPIIIGLLEPPPQAALFPPIASSAFHDSHGRNSLNTLPPKLKEPKEHPRIDDRLESTAVKKSMGKQKAKKDVKARKKWTEDETKNLLLGVHKYGVGRWSDILDDPSFAFNERSGVDLKDRFRTCCPDELRKHPLKPKDSPKRLSSAKKTKSSLMSENILIEEGEGGPRGVENKINGPGALRKSRTHRKKMEDLAELGIDEPFRKSQRRERRPFTEQDDREILAGYQIYGPVWTRIQRDSRFHLQSRQATDLRDRFRNKYPEKFRVDDAPSKDMRKLDRRQDDTSVLGPHASILQPSSSREGLKIHEIITEVETSLSKPLPALAQNSSFGFRDFPFSDQTTEPTDGLPSFDWPGTSQFTEGIGEMDISRLLLDEPSWIDTSKSKEKQTFTDINSILTSTADDLPQISSYYGMLVSDEQISMPSSSVALDSSFG